MARPSFSFASLACAPVLLIALSGGAQPVNPPKSTNDPIARIRNEGLNRSRVMNTVSNLTEVIGPRLTGSPNLHRANEWTRDQLAEWGLTNAQAEPWGVFGRGWSLQKFSAQVVAPQQMSLTAWPNAWSGGLDQPLTAEAVYLDARTEAGFKKFEGKLKGKIVLVSSPAEVKLRTEPLATRMTEPQLLTLANATPGQRVLAERVFTNAPPGAAGTNRPTTTTRRAGSTPGSNAPAVASTNRSARLMTTTDRMSFAVREGAALVAYCSSKGDGGTIFVTGAALPVRPASTNRTSRPANSPRVWTTNAPVPTPQITVNAEDYNRLVRLIQRGAQPRVTVDLQVQFHADDPVARNTVAEIPGTDLKRELVLLGAHLDSWHAGTGATDNAGGVAVCMEAVRILKALNLQPRRTIRIALWTGEEQGLLGSKAYVSNHFGHVRPAATNFTVARSPRAASQQPATTPRPGPKLTRQKDYDRVSAYFNLDNGTGKIRGIYLQGNEAARPLFRQWLEPFRDLGAATLSPAITGSTDHIPFDDIGLPGFQFIQDQVEYSTRTHHSNIDVLDHVSPDDLKQAAVIMAAFVYQAAMLDEKLPRKPFPSAPVPVAPSTNAPVARSGNE